MLLPRLDARLRAAYDLIDPCARYADIGADHGLLPLHLVADKRVGHAIVADISESALQRAQETFRKHAIAASFVVADGLSALTAPCDFVSILGMGGDTMLGILRSGRAHLGDARLILSPHTDLSAVRQGVFDMGYVFEKESLVRAKGRMYVIMRLQKGHAAYNETELLLGPCLLKTRPPLFSDYLLWRKKVAIEAAAPELPLIEEAIRCL